VAGAGLGELDRLADGRVRRDAVEEHELEEPELERGPDGRLELAVDVLGDHVVEGQASLDGAECQLLGERAVTGVESAGLAVQRAIGEGTVDQCAAHDGVRRTGGRPPRAGPPTASWCDGRGRHRVPR
jgi:hypothetical protein